MLLFCLFISFKKPTFAAKSERLNNSLLLLSQCIMKRLYNINYRFVARPFHFGDVPLLCSIHTWK